MRFLSRNRGLGNPETRKQAVSKALEEARQHYHGGNRDQAREPILSLRDKFVEAEVSPLELLRAAEEEFTEDPYWLHAINEILLGKHQLAEEELYFLVRQAKKTPDRIDLWQLHALRSPDDVQGRIDRRVVDVAQQAREEGKVRHIGFTGHADPDAHRRMLERAGDVFATCQMPINPVDAAAKSSFIRSVLPGTLDRGYGVLAMKTLADGRFFGRKVVNDRVRWRTDTPLIPRKLTIADCIHFALSLPIAVLITGAEKPELLREKATLTRRFEQLNEAQRTALIEKVAGDAAVDEVEYYKR